MAFNTINVPLGSKPGLGIVGAAITDNFSVDQQDSFWYQPDINPLNWNQQFPYSLIILKRTMDTSGNVTYSESDQGKYTLPFPPESISISTPYAVNVSATLGGIVEEHNGAPFRMISFQGSLGVLSTRPISPSRKSNTNGIFGGTLNTFNSSNNAVQNLLGALPPPALNLVNDSDLLEEGGKFLGTQSGYYRMEQLKNFLENYHNLKKTTKGAAYQLAVGMFKQQAVYLVTTSNFVADQNASSPLEYRYSLQFKAWKRINPNSNPVSDYNFVSVVSNVNQFQATIAVLQGTQDVVNSYADRISAVAGQIDQTLLGPMRQTILFGKDALGIALSLSDLPDQLIKESQSAVINYVADQVSSLGVSGFLATFSSPSQATIKKVNNIIDLSQQLQQPTIGAGQAAQTIGTTQTSLGVASSSGSQVVGILASHPGNAAFNDPSSNYDIWSNIQVSSLNISPALSRRILQARDAVRNLSRLDFENYRDSIANVQADFSDAVGAGSATFNATFGRGNVVSTKTPTEDDFNVMFALNRTTTEIARLAATYQTNLFNVSSVNFVAGAASRSGIAFNKPRSKFSVPYPYGVTIEQLSTRYLGTPDRWIEIATLNGLRTPYVDEEGFDVLLLTNGKNNNVYVADSTNLYVGQNVWISSNNTSRTQRTITKITKISNSYVQLTVNGDPDLARFSTLAGAVLHAFLPDTVNSMMTIYIPSSDDPQDQDYQTKAIPGISDYENFFQAGGVDLLLTDTNDLAITPDGDCRLAVGLPNIIQQARIALSVIRGTLNRHPEFGIPQIVGQNTADVDVNQIAASLGGLFAGNTTFSSVGGILVNKIGPSVAISMSVGVRGISQNIPLTFNLPTT